MSGALKRVLTIAGSDSGGGAGIQADLKTCTALGCYGMSVITAVTAQNTVEVRSIHELPAEEVEHQLVAVLDDIGVDAVKTGMLANAEIIERVASLLKRFETPNIVVDPVMVSKSGAHLLRDDAVEALKRHLAPLATMITPNVPEASVLTGIALEGYTAVRNVLESLHALGSQHVLLKGGHFESLEAADYLFDGSVQSTCTAQRIDTKNTHGTGCTYSAAIACFLAQGCTPADAVRRAKEYLTGAIHGSALLQIGHGAGPLHHGWNLDIICKTQ
mgnify:CR=1 FL=1